MFWILVSNKRRIFFEEASTKFALKQMHKAKSQHNEEFELYGKLEDVGFEKISDTRYYIRESNTACNQRRMERRLRRTRRKK